MQLRSAACVWQIHLSLGYLKFLSHRDVALKMAKIQSWQGMTDESYWIRDSPIRFDFEQPLTNFTAPNKWSDKTHRSSTPPFNRFTPVKKWWHIFIFCQRYFDYINFWSNKSSTKFAKISPNCKSRCLHVKLN